MIGTRCRRENQQKSMNNILQKILFSRESEGSISVLKSGEKGSVEQRGRGREGGGPLCSARSESG